MIEIAKFMCFQVQANTFGLTCQHTARPVLVERATHPSCTCSVLLAVARNHLACFRYYHENHAIDLSTRDKVCRLAGAYDSMECFRFAYHNGYPCEQWTIADFAFSGKLELLKYVKEHGSRFGPYVGEYAAMQGHLDCLRYVYERGCDVDPNPGLVWIAIDHDRVNCLQFAMENARSIVDLEDCKQRALRNGRIECLTYLYKQTRK